MTARSWKLVVNRTLFSKTRVNNGYISGHGLESQFFTKTETCNMTRKLTMSLLSSDIDNSKCYNVLENSFLVFIGQGL
jgi:predicted DNA-binding ribbon-helix-helix protein